MPHRLISPRRLRDRIGRRGIVLVLFGIAWVMQGAAVFLVGDDPRVGSPFWHQSLPDVLLGSMWAVTGLASIVGGLTPRYYNDTYGFLAVSGMPMVLAGAYGVGAITRALLGDPTWVIALIRLSLWGVIALALSIVSAWPEELRGE